ncbi:MAG: DUF4301 family protein [Brumimicrobium sp.]|nr:DUF4301 family protein [Brumimicrobium sp.]MCO5267551.1 DUF4301 family protein [Brumimicrobium sp.]
MEIKENSAVIEKYRALTFGEQPEVILERPCKMDDGIIHHADFEKNKFRFIFSSSEQEITFFIPASGSGSRMFNFLYDFLDNPTEESRGNTEKFLNSISDFAFFELLPYALKKKVKNYDVNLDEFISYLLKSSGLGLGDLPKGLIPFHRSRSFILNAFQEQLLQGLRVKDDDISFHFTINKEYEGKIKDALLAIQHLTGRRCNITWSEQNISTNSIAFDDSQQVVYANNEEILTRPSGHGALLNNLDAINSDIIFIKNIDNVQHEIYSQDSIDLFKYLGGLLIEFKKELKAAYLSDNQRDELTMLNERYQFISPDMSFINMSKDQLDAIVLRPIRICGMVKNEGQPGGGPFWVNEGGIISKQIVEKAQINNKGEQYKIMVQSQYFNPVLMAVSTTDIFGNKLSLTNFSDPNKYFKVEKTHLNKTIHFIELPGLWNGSMANWTSVFVDAPSTAFTPVKTVLDLLTNAHTESKP